MWGRALVEKLRGAGLSNYCKTTTADRRDLVFIWLSGL